MAERRPIASRNTRWARNVSAALARRGIRPNAISVASVACAIVSAGCLVATRFTHLGWQTATLLVLAALAIQCRLLCNLFDGMVAVEGGLSSPTGEVYNEFPDRVSDVVILVAAGYAATWVPWASVAGWVAAMMALLTAYVRAMGTSCGATAFFGGPMSKSHRMAALTVALLGSLVELEWGFEGRILVVALVLISLGCAITVFRRLRHIIRELEAC